MTYLENDATLSDCGHYRYVLSRLWNPERDTVVFCMLNPSTADAANDDPTIRKCVSLANSWGYGRLVVVNLFAFRATDPRELRKANNPVGPDNDVHIAEQTAGRVTICAWGATAMQWPTPKHMPTLKWAARADAVRSLIEKLGQPRHLGLTQDQHPRHPLYVPGTVRPSAFDG